MANIENKNFLSPIGFQLSVQKLPHVNYFCTSASIPDINLGQADLENTFIRLPIPGDKLTFGQLNLSFRVDEDLKNFSEIYNWMQSIGFPDNFAQRAPAQRANEKNTTATTVYSDASLIILTNQYKPNIEVKFLDMYPVSLGSLDFNVESTDVAYLSGEVTFAYRKYELNVLN
jgi:hypothetical protein